MASPHLAPLPQPGLPIFPSFTAQKPSTFLMKGRDLWSSKASFLISHASPSGEAGAAFLEIREREKSQISFLTIGGDGGGKEIMRIVKECHSGWSKNKSGTEYHALRGDGTEAWYLKLHSGWSGTDFGKYTAWHVLLRASTLSITYLRQSRLTHPVLSPSSPNHQRPISSRSQHPSAEQDPRPGEGNPNRWQPCCDHVKT